MCYSITSLRRDGSPGNRQRGHPGARERHPREPRAGLEGRRQGENLQPGESRKGLPGALRELLVTLLARLRRRESSFMEGAERGDPPELERGQGPAETRDAARGLRVVRGTRSVFLRRKKYNGRRAIEYYAPTRCQATFIITKV